MAIIISLVSAVVLTAADQIIKYFVLQNLAPVGCVDFIKGFIGWRYVENTGAAFGSFSGNTVLLSVFTGVVIAAIAVLIITKRIKTKYYLVCAVMIMAGGLGNLIDRVFRGFVIDFIEFQFFDFAVFNFADMLVTCGAGLVIIYLLVDIIRDIKRKPKGDKSE